jgi:hypothetical protein
MGKPDLVHSLPSPRGPKKKNQRSSRYVSRDYLPELGKVVAKNDLQQN